MINVRAYKCSVNGCERRGYARGVCRLHYDRTLKHGSHDGERGSSPGEAQTFLQYAKEFGGDDCLFWPYAKDSDGYAMVNTAGRVQSVQTIICEYANGPAPTEKHETAHSCGNGHLGCVSPPHLRWATHAENMADAASQGRWAGRSTKKLTREQVETIIIQSREGNGPAALAREYGVSRSAIARIKRCRLDLNSQETKS